MSQTKKEPSLFIPLPIFLCEFSRKEKKVLTRESGLFNHKVYRSWSLLPMAPWQIFQDFVDIERKKKRNS